MSKLTQLEVSERAKAGKGAARATRRAGLVPGVIYGDKQAPVPIEIDPRLIIKEMERGGWGSRLYRLNVGKEQVRALLRDIQFHPVSDAPLHVDFQRMRQGQKIHVQVPVMFEGEDEAVGIKKGGVLNVIHHAIDVDCDVDHMPERFVADIKSLDVGDSIRWVDLSGTEGMHPHGEVEDLVVATITPPLQEAAEEEQAEAETEEAVEK